MSDFISDFKSGDELTADLVNAIISELRRWRKIGSSPPIQIDYADGVDGEPPQVWADPVLGTYPAMLPGTAIATDATGTVTFMYNASGVLTAGSDTVSAINPYTTSTPASKRCWIYYFQGNWFILGWDC